MQGASEARFVLPEVLQAEFPLVDSTLILSLVSDYDEPSAHINEIRDQLGIIEATAVIDAEEAEADRTLRPDDQVSQIDQIASTLDSTSISSSGQAKSLAPGVLLIPNGIGKNGPSGQASNSEASASASGSGSGSGRTSKSAESDPTTLSEDGSYEAEMDLLKSLFDTLPEKTIKDALLSENSLDAAIDHLLSSELIRDVEHQGHWPGKDTTDIESGTDTDNWQSAAQAKVKSTLPAPKPTVPRKKKKAPKLPIVDTLQRLPTPTSRPTSRSSHLSGTSTPSSVSGPSSNAWGTIASLSSYLSDLLSIPQSHFSSYLHSPKYHSALSAVRAAIAVTSPRNLIDQDSRHILEDMYSVHLQQDPTIARDLELCVRVAEDVSIAMDLMDLLEELSHWPGGDDPLASTDDEAVPAISREEVIAKAAARNGFHSVPLTPTSSTEHLSDTSSIPERLLTRPKTSTAKRKQEKERSIPGSQPAPSALTNPTISDSFGQPSSYTPLLTKKANGKQIHPQNWKQVASRQKQSQLHPLSGSIPAYAPSKTSLNTANGSIYRSSRSSHSTQAQGYYAKAQIEREKRAEAIRAAATHFRGSGLAGGKGVNMTVAGHYASQAREAEVKAKEWELKAARATISSQFNHHTESSTSNTQGGLGKASVIDLHNLTVEEATTVALEIVEQWYDRERANSGGNGVTVNPTLKTVKFTPRNALVVVTGVGRHSAGRKGVLGPAVGSALRGAGWRVDKGEDTRGYLVVKGKL